MILPATNNHTFEVEKILIDNEDVKGSFTIDTIRYYSIYVTVQSNNISDELVSLESTECILQFTNVFELIFFKKLAISKE